MTGEPPATPRPRSWGELSPAPPASGILLAGGRSARFGNAAPAGRSKLAARLAGRPILDHALASLAATVREVVIVGLPGPQAGGLDAGRAADPATRWIPDREPFGGPLAGLAAGLEHVRHELVLVLAGDMPRVRPDILRLLLARLAGQPRGDLVLLEADGAAVPLPMAVRRAGPATAAASRVLGAGHRSLRAFAEELGCVLVAEAEWRALDPDADSLRDVDTLADLEALEGS